MTQVYNPSIRQDALLGYHYDWIRPDNLRQSPVTCIVNLVDKKQPINQVNTKVNGKYLPGGDWVAWQHRTYKVVSDSVRVVRPGWYRAYEGHFYLRDVPPSAIPPPQQIYSTAAMLELTAFLEGLGAEGFAKARPAAPDFSVATNLLELKDLPGMFKQSIHLLINRIVAKRPDLYYSYGRNAFFKHKDKSRLSHTAEWYLALEFGWLPIIKGIQDFIKASHSLDISLKQLLRDEGKSIRRRRKLDLAGSPRDFDALPESTWVYVNNPHPGMQPILVTQCYPGGAHPVKETYRLEQKAEFVASFRYWLPEGPRDYLWTKRIRRRMLGSRITPSVAWNLMPWTFLIDYFSTLNKAIENLGPGVEDQLYTEWCYITYREDWFRSVDVGLDVRKGDWGEPPAYVDAAHKEHSKLRVRISADPFAFRFRGGGPSLKQKAILAALAAK